MKLNQFIATSHLDADLIRAVVRQSGGWSSFTEMAKDIADHGIGGGFHGWIYYADTVAFAKRNKAQIMAMARELANDIGEDVFAMIGGFNCLKMDSAAVAEAIYNPRSDDSVQVFNALAWFAAEEVARSYCDISEE